LIAPDRLSLYDEIRMRGYEASVIATYGLNFQFYERVVLRRLQSSGCRHNILLADVAQCAEALADEESRPQLCGSDYSLFPVRAPGAFHPKFILLLGRKKSRLIIGSHNLTISGFGLNREIATTIDVHRDSSDLAAARAVWQFVLAWTATFPREIRNVLTATERLEPWMVPADGVADESSVFCSLPLGPSLWTQVKPCLAADVRRISILSPYFDSKLAFLGVLQKQLHPKEIVVAVHPEFTEICSKAKSLAADTRFVDVSQLGDAWARTRLHAKVYRFELFDGTSIVISGSANASTPAWTAAPSERNAEVVIVHKDGNTIWKRLGLSPLSDLPDVDPAGWEQIRIRTAQTRNTNVTSEMPYLSTITSNGFHVSSDFTRDVTADRINIIVGGKCEGSIEQIEVKGNQATCVCLDGAIRGAATRLETNPANQPLRFALIHHVDDLLDKAAGNIRQVFRKAFSGLEGDPDQLTELLRVVEKAIFDDPVALDPIQAAEGRESRSRITRDSTAEPTSLMISAKETNHSRRLRRRVLASSDLALIIDALIYRLGKGLHQDVDGPATVRPSDVDLRDEVDTVPPEIDGYALAKVCRGKINRLFRRMAAQLEIAVTRGKDATTPIIQLAAVLGVVKHLRVRQVNFEWLPRGEDLIDRGRQSEFFLLTSQFLYAPSRRLAALALSEHNGQEFDELTAVRGLLTWLAIDSGVDIRSALKKSLSDPDLTREKLVEVGYLVPVITECATDTLAAAMLTNIAEEQRNECPTRAAYHIEWARRLLVTAKSHGTKPAAVELGDMAVPTRVKGAPLSIVVDVQANKSGLLDLDTGEAKFYATGYLSRVLGLSV